MPGRKYTAPSSTYRYGFNGKEEDDEVKGDGNQQDYGMRIYDPRLGRFLSVDPLSKKFPELSVFQFSSDNPIQNIDIDGMEGGGANGAATNTRPPVVPPGSVTLESSGGESNLSVNQNGKLQTNINLGTLPTNSSLLPAQTRLMTSDEISRYFGYNSVGYNIDYKNYTITIYDVNGGSFTRSLLKPVAISEIEVFSKISLSKATKAELIRPKIDNSPNKSDDKLYITLYRGVSPEINPKRLFTYAQGRIVIPKGLLKEYCSFCHDDSEDHTMGDNISVFTSWTTSKQTAERFARGPSGSALGVILTIRVKRSDAIETQLSRLMQEDEYLLKGVLIADKVEDVEKN